MNTDLRTRIERLSVPEPNTGCWLWTGTLNNGYGMVGAPDGKKRLAHRVSYAEYVGDPSGKIVMHACDTPACVNPDHLRLGSHRDNAVDATRKLRTKFSRASAEQRQAWASQSSLSGLKASAGLSLSERIERMSVPEPNTGCHLWLGPLNNGGYGKIKVDGRMCIASRVSYAANVGAIPSGMMVLHKCDTPACVNPTHLFLGNARDNIVDAMRKGRATMVRVSTEQRAEWTKKRVAREAGTRPDTARRGWKTRRENGREFTMTPEQSSERSKKSWVTRVERYGRLGVSREWSRSGAAKSGWAKLTPEERAARVQSLVDARRLAKEARVAASRPKLRFNLIAPRLTVAPRDQHLTDDLVPFVRHWIRRGHSVESIAVAFNVTSSEIERVAA